MFSRPCEHTNPMFSNPISVTFTYGPKSDACPICVSEMSHCVNENAQIGIHVAFCSYACTDRGRQ